MLFALFGQEGFVLFTDEYGQQVLTDPSGQRLFESAGGVRHSARIIRYSPTDHRGRFQ